MIETFTIKNYRCYREESVLSFVASKKEGRRANLPPIWYKEVGDKRILRLLLCIGPNGSGKSKMFSALGYLRMLATARPIKPTEKPSYRPFLLDSHSYNEPTELSLTYYIEETCYYYYIKISQDRIEEEELSLKSNRINRIYYRTHDIESDKVVISFGNICDLSKTDKHDLEVNTLPNASVLSVFASLNLDSPILSKNYDYFDNHISFVKKSDKSLADKLQTGDMQKDLLMKKMILRLLKDVKTNICDYVINEAALNISDIEATGAPDVLIKAMREQYPSGVIVHKNLRFIHSTSECKKELDSELESFGTLNIIRLAIVMFDVILGNKSTCIDEIESGIHTKALLFIIKMYLSLAKDCQLIVATHDLQVLNVDFLRRDAVREFEKEETGSISIKKREYMHNTISYFRTYYKDVSKGIDEAIDKFDIFDDYQEYLRDE